VVYDLPVNVFVAAFIGSPAMNLYEGVLAPDAASVRLGSQTLTVPESVHTERPALRSFADRKLVVGVRPEDLSDASLAQPGANGGTLAGDVKLVEALGSELMVHFQIDASRVLSADAAAASEDQDELADLAASELSARATGVACVNTRSKIREGERAAFTVDTERLHFFDPESGAAIRG
jgi:multiple sugar transport system ATP-binding protein